MQDNSPTLLELTLTPEEATQCSNKYLTQELKETVFNSSYAIIVWVWGYVTSTQTFNLLHTPILSSIKES